MKKIILVAMIVALFVSVPLATKARAAEIDVLLEKLVEKGVLTPLEAQIVKDETKQDVAEQLSKGQQDTLPSWIQAMKLNGDFRLRFQTEKKDSDHAAANRGRYRLRVGAEANPVSNVKVGFGLASGNSNDSRSTNQTMDDNFGKDSIWIDYAYAEYTPMQDLSMIGGKFNSKNYLWRTTDLLWDSDINPEGASLSYSHSIAADTTAFFNTGSWIIDEITSRNSSATDPFLFYAQAGVGVEKEKFDAKLAGVYYGFSGIQGMQLDHAKNGNTVNGSNKLIYDYDSLGGSAEVGVNKLFGGLPMGMDERIALFGDYNKNISSGVTKDAGWAAGVKFGSAKVKEKGSWQMKYMYADLDKDAFPDSYPDSDRYSGKTNIKGHELALDYGLMKNVTFGLDYYRSNVKKGTKDVENLFQADVVVKF